jgi:large subunit ribosomal protein L31
MIARVGKTLIMPFPAERAFPHDPGRWGGTGPVLRPAAKSGYNPPLYFARSAEPKPMKADIHPKYNDVVFQDVSSDLAILTRSTMTSKDTIKWQDGKEYPLIKVEISSASHPFYTGKHKVIDAGGRVDKFRKRYGAGK